MINCICKATNADYMTANLLFNLALNQNKVGGTSLPLVY